MNKKTLFAASSLLVPMAMAVTALSAPATGVLCLLDYLKEIDGMKRALLASLLLSFAFSIGSVAEGRHPDVAAFEEKVLQADTS